MPIFSNFFHFLYVLEPKERNGSILVLGTPVSIRVKKKTINWPWKIKSGKCMKLLQLCPDCGTQAKMKYFDRSK